LLQTVRHERIEYVLWVLALVTMRHSLRSHILFLENTIQDLRNRLTSSRLNVDEVQDIELQLTLAESALAHYRQAFALESSVAGSEPPSQPGESGNNGSAGGPAESKPDKDKGRLVASAQIRTKVLRVGLLRPSRRGRARTAAA
jgi:hypothetical protein